MTSNRNSIVVRSSKGWPRRRLPRPCSFPAAPWDWKTRRRPVSVLRWGTLEWGTGNGIFQTFFPLAECQASRQRTATRTDAKRWHRSAKERPIKISAKCWHATTSMPS